MVVAKVITSRTVYFPKARRRAFEAIVHDETGSLTLRWFNVVLYLKGALFKRYYSFIVWKNYKVRERFTDGASGDCNF